MKIQLALIAGLSAVSVAAAAAPVSDKASPVQPVKLTPAELDKIVAGANDTNPNSNGASGAPGNSWDGGGKGAPGQTGNPHPAQ